MQFDLELSRQEEPDGRTFYADRNGLVEQVGQVVLTYGYWDRHFGCWIRDCITGEVREIVPNWTVLNASGHGQDPASMPERKDILRRAVGRTPSGDLAFFSFFQSIPYSLRRLVSSFAQFQWGVLDCLRSDAQFAEFVDTLQQNKQSNFLLAALLLGAPKKCPRTRRKNLAHRLRTKKRVECLNELSVENGLPAAWDSRRLKILYKLSEPLTSVHQVKTFLDIVSSPIVLTYAGHASTISLEGLKAFAALLRVFPSGFPVPNVIEAFSEFFDAEGITPLLDVVVSELPASMTTKVGQWLYGLRTEFDVFTWMAKIEEELYLHQVRSSQFPQPPLDSNQQLIALGTFDRLAHEARHMRNCVMSRALDVVKNEVYFYHWRGEEEATVELTRDDDGFWGLSEALGRNNAPISYATREAIERCVISRLEALNSAPSSGWI